MKTITYDETKWKLVPLFPDVNMTEAGMGHVLSGQDYERAQGCWKAMLAATPTPPADERDELKAMHAAARHAGWTFAKYADGVVRMIPLVAGEAQAADGQTHLQKWSSVIKNLPMDGQAQQDADKTDADPVAYLRASDLERLAKPHVAGCAASLSKTADDGFIAIYADARAKQGGQP